MPKISVGEDYDAIPSKHEIGFSGQVASVGIEPDAILPKTIAEDNLQRCARRSYALHTPSPLRRREVIHGLFAGAG